MYCQVAVELGRSYSIGRSRNDLDVCPSPLHRVTAMLLSRINLNYLKRRLSTPPDESALVTGGAAAYSLEEESTQRPTGQGG
jgi:hypothetical protein